MELAQTLSNLSPQAKALFLARAIHDATTFARLSPPEKIQDAITFIHRLSGYQKDALTGREWATPDIQAETITEHFKAMAIEPDIAGWLRGL